MTTTTAGGAEVESVRWGVLGAARIAREQVVPAIRRSGCGEVVAVSSASGRARPYADELGIPRAYGTHEELLADPGVDAVYLALPNALHAPWIVRAAQAGKHVLCEKPLVLGAGELEEVERAVAAAGVQLTEAFMYRHHPQQARVRDLLRSGAVGAPVAVSARLHFPLDRTGEPDIRLRPDLGGGSLLDLGCYPVDLFGSLLGGEPEEVAAVASRESGVDTRLAAVLRYGDVVASLDCSFDAPFLNTATVVGTEGVLTLTDAFRPDLTGGIGTVLVHRGGGTERIEVEGDQYAAQVRAFTAALADRPAAEADAELSRRTVRTVERIARAASPA
ncbi:Gfo/Idh/MocA family protein [Geodermatophilus sp. SYSU D00815]